MKNLLIFLFGAAVGAGGTFLYLRKDIKNKLEEINNKETEEPFVMEEDKKEAVVQGSTEPPVMANNVTPEMRTEYHKLVNETKDEDEEPEIHGRDETDGGVFEIDADEFLHNHAFEKKRLVYYRGDLVMATENGTIIVNPSMLVGCEWEKCVGNYANRTAFIRNPNLVEDYEIYVEDCAYTDEHPSEELHRED